MFSAIPSKKKGGSLCKTRDKKTMKKIISLVVVAIMLVMTTIPASATNTLVATQTGSSSAPAFKLNESKAYCLDSELKAPQEVEYEYSTSYSNEGVKNILVNAYLNNTNQRVVQLALWGQLNGNVKRYRTIAPACTRRPGISLHQDHSSRTHENQAAGDRKTVPRLSSPANPISDHRWLSGTMGLFPAKL